MYVYIHIRIYIYIYIYTYICCSVAKQGEQVFEKLWCRWFGGCSIVSFGEVGLPLTLSSPLRFTQPMFQAAPSPARRSSRQRSREALSRETSSDENPFVFLDASRTSVGWRVPSMTVLALGIPVL